MARYQVRTLRRDDFDTIMNLEHTLFGACGDGTLGPYYVRLCCDFFASSCFLVEVEGRAVGYLLSFVRDRVGYCTTLAMVPEYQGTRAIVPLLRAFTQAVLATCDEVWFTVEEDNKAARSLHAMLGAEELEVRDDFYGAGRPRIISRIDRAALERSRGRFECLGLVGERPRITAAA
jgi:ribosomal protein S18 acetylase RimI-like enzyme